jgi:hypothetical protein
MNISSQGRWTIERIEDPAIRTLEVWREDFGDILPGAAGRLLYQAVGSQRLDALRAQCASARVASETLGRDLARSIRLLLDRDFGGAGCARAVWLGGGLLNSEGVREALLNAGLPIPVIISDDPTFCAAPGGRQLLAQHGDGRGVVVDVGQTSIKGIAFARGRARQLVFPRDHHSLPLRLQERSELLEPGQSHLFIERAAGFIARAVFSFGSVREPPPPLLVLALPTTLSSDGTPQGCTYPGWEGSTELVPRIATQLDEWIQADHGHPWRNVPGRILLLNDAELAARSARLNATVAASGKVLVMTVGFGPGAALLSLA